MEGSIAPLAGRWREALASRKAGALKVLTGGNDAGESEDTHDNN